MCFYISSSEQFKKQKIAKRGITCYKVGLRTTNLYSLTARVFESRYMNYQYHAGVKAYARLEVVRNTVESGFHSYTSIDDARAHTFSGDGRSVALFRIPKGATYYENPRDREYVSDQIIFVKFVRKTKPRRATSARKRSTRIRRQR